MRRGRGGDPRRGAPPSGRALDRGGDRSRSVRARGGGEELAPGRRTSSRSTSRSSAGPDSCAPRCTPGSASRRGCPRPPTPRSSRAARSPTRSCGSSSRSTVARRRRARSPQLIPDGIPQLWHGYGERTWEVIAAGRRRRPRRARRPGGRARAARRPCRGEQRRARRRGGRAQSARDPVAPDAPRAPIRPTATGRPPGRPARATEPRRRCSSRPASVRGSPVRA